MPQPRTEIINKGESIDTFAERVGVSNEELHKLNKQTAFEAGGVINLPDLVEDPNSGIVSSTTELRDEETDVRVEAQTIAGITQEDITAATDTTPFSETPEGQEALQGITDLQSSIGILTESEISKIEGAGEAAGAEFDILIEEAQEQKREGRAEALVGAGERGGLLNTQFAGIAALTRIEGKTFEGAGGKLEEIKGIYDRNISMLRAKKLNAVNQAKAAAEKAIRTGKREDLVLAQNSFKFSQEISQEAADLAREKIDTITGLQDAAIKQKQFESTEEGKAVKAAQDQLNFFLDNFGLDYFRNNREEIESLFEGAGYEGFDYTTMIKEMEAANEASTWQIQSVGGDLYQLELDQNGKVISKEVVAYKRFAPKSQTSTEKNQEIISEMNEQLDGVAGEDGNVSPDDYAVAKKAWAAEGKSPSDFDKQFSGFRDSNNPNYQLESGTEASERKPEDEQFIDESYIRDELGAKEKKIAGIMKTVNLLRDAGKSDADILDTIIKESK